MFANGIKKAVTGRVRIEDVGLLIQLRMLEPSAMDKKLFIVADKYQVTTLLEAVPSGFTQPADSTGVGILKVFQPLKLF